MRFYPKCSQEIKPYPKRAHILRGVYSLSDLCHTLSMCVTNLQAIYVAEGYEVQNCRIYAPDQ